MTVLSDQEILGYLKRKVIKIKPFEASLLNPAGYDLRSSNRVIIEPKGYEATASLETVELGLTVMGELHIRSSLAREGLIGSFAVVDPGFRGQLTLNVHNEGPREVTIQDGEPIVQIVFHKLAKPAREGYSGKYQNSTGIMPSKRHKL